MANRKLEVEIIGDSRSLERAFGRASKSGSGLGRSLSNLGSVAAVGVGAAFVGLAATLKVGFDELAEGQKVAAQTGAALKSTGGIANVTAKQIADLASAQSKLTGIDDELIQSGENLLLTFKNVRNEVGEGNKVFDRATKSALDLSVAGFGSVESASKMMGKALNDPIKGMTALGRAGVTFSEDQKKAIKALVETGDVLGAQKLILKEVESQVGGSAKAYGETLPGQLSKLKNSFEEMAGGIAASLLPVLTRLLDWVNQNMPTIQRVIQGAIDGISAAVGFLTPVFDAIIAGFRRLAAAAQKHWPEVQAAAKNVTDWYRANVAPTFESVHRNVIRIWDKMGSDLQTSAKGNLSRLPPLFSAQLGNMGSVITGALALIRGDWSKAWHEFGEIPKRTFMMLVDTIKILATTLYQAAVRVGQAIVDGIRAGISAAWGGLTSWIGEKMADLKDAITHPWRIFSPSRVTMDIGKQIAEGLGVGFGLGMVTVQQQVADKIRASIDAMIQVVGDRRSAFGAAFSSLASEALAAFDKLASDLMTKTEKKIAAQDAARAKAGRADDLRSAKAGLEAAIGAGMALTQGEGETAADFAARQTEAGMAIIAAQKAVAEAEFAIQRAKDEKIAVQERKALDDKTALRRRHFQEELAALETQATRIGMSATAMNNRLLAIFKSYGVPFKKGANELGSALAEGLRDAMAEVESAAVALKEMIMKYLSNIQIRINVDVVAPDKPKKRQHGGPVAAGSPYVVGEAGPELFVPRSAGKIVPNGGSVGSSAGAVYLTVNFPNYLGDANRAATQIQNLLLQKQRRGGTLGFS